MKTRITAILCIVAVFGAAVMVALPAKAGIVGGPHDLSVSLGIEEICVPCHAPHNSRSPLDGPIWNHALSDQTFMRNGEVVTLGWSSKLCMGCHDGVTAVGSYGNLAGLDPLTGGAAIGTDLTNDHPIGVDYPLSGHGWYDPVAVPEVGDLLEDGKVECSSCHRAHSASIRIGMVGSALCLTCHNK